MGEKKVVNPTEQKESVSGAETEKPSKKKAKYLPFLVIIPVLFLMAALGVAYWQINRVATEQEEPIVEDPVIEEPVVEDEEDDGEGDSEEAEVIELNLKEISDSLREVDDAIYDVDVTIELIDDSLSKNDDIPEL